MTVPPADPLTALIAQLRERAAEHRCFHNVPCQCDSTWHADELDGWADQLESLLGSLRGREGQWQDIATAPKDGTTVIVFRHLCGFNVIGTAHWFQAESMPALSGWVARGVSNICPSPGELGLAAPTHWMPLPAPPQGGREDPHEPDKHDELTRVDGSPCLDGQRATAPTDGR